MTSRILNRFNNKTDRLLHRATDKLSCDIHPRKMINMVRRVSRDHIIIVVIMVIVLLAAEHGLNFFLVYAILIDLYTNIDSLSTMSNPMAPPEPLYDCYSAQGSWMYTESERFIRRVLL